MLESNNIVYKSTTEFLSFLNKSSIDNKKKKKSKNLNNKETKLSEILFSKRN